MIEGVLFERKELFYFIESISQICHAWNLSNFENLIHQRYCLVQRIGTVH